MTNIYYIFNIVCEEGVIEILKLFYLIKFPTAIRSKYVMIYSSKITIIITKMSLRFNI